MVSAAIAGKRQPRSGLTSVKTRGPDLPLASPTPSADTSENGGVNGEGLDSSGGCGATEGGGK